MISMNRNTSPISPFTEEDYITAYKETKEHDYPSSGMAQFKEIYADLYGFDPSNLELANGSDEWIQKLMITFGKGGVLTLDPDFFMYQDYAQQLDVEIKFVASDDAYNFNIEKILEEIDRVQPELFILSNPHNPTGKQFDENFLQKISEAMKVLGGYFAIDEAYIEFGNDYKRPTGDHVIILRTMSKIYGMAGLRIGVLHATGETYRLLTKINHPYPVNSVCLTLASTFLEDKERRQTFVDYQLNSKSELVKSFNQVKEQVAIKESATNFVFTYGELALSLGLYLQNKGFAPRFYQADDEDEEKDMIRYSIIGLEDYSELNQAIKEWSEKID